MAEFDFWIEEYPINPPVGRRLGFGAKAVVKRIPKGELLHLDEHLGETKEEARSKAEADAATWIENRKGE